MGTGISTCYKDPFWDCPNAGQTKVQQSFTIQWSVQKSSTVVKHDVKLSGQLHMVKYQVSSIHGQDSCDKDRVTREGQRDLKSGQSKVTWGCVQSNQYHAEVKYWIPASM